jgi:predicted TIM-barrel fold metal-dependent hydrolase
MDEHWEARQHVVRNRVPHPPSDYFKRQCFVGIEADETPGKYAIDWGAGNNIVFSTDFPHPDSKFPNSVKTLVGQSLSDEAKRKILWENCARLYNFH